MSVEPIIRSHQTRVAWFARFTFATFVWGVNIHGGIITFADLDLNILYYAPQEPKHTAYDLQVVGGSDALTEGRLMKFTAYPNLAFVEDVCRIFGYGEVKALFKKGYVFDPGYTYIIAYDQWTDKPTFDISFAMTGVVDILPEVFLG